MFICSYRFLFYIDFQMCENLINTFCPKEKKYWKCQNRKKNRANLRSECFWEKGTANSSLEFQNEATHTFTWAQLDLDQTVCNSTQLSSDLWIWPEGFFSGLCSLPVTHLKLCFPPVWGQWLNEGPEDNQRAHSRRRVYAADPSGSASSSSFSPNKSHPDIWPVWFTADLKLSSIL